jgi:hypothetical protein
MGSVDKTSWCEMFLALTGTVFAHFLPDVRVIFETSRSDSLRVFSKYLNLQESCILEVLIPLVFIIKQGIFLRFLCADETVVQTSLNRIMHMNAHERHSPFTVESTHDMPAPLPLLFTDSQNYCRNSNLTRGLVHSWRYIVINKVLLYGRSSEAAIGVHEL